MIKVRALERVKFWYLQKFIAKSIFLYLLSTLSPGAFDDFDEHSGLH